LIVDDGEVRAKAGVCDPSRGDASNAVHGRQ
jgi:hypothetical protein